MAPVRASCPTCGDVEIGIRDIQVEVCSATDKSTYSFVCPTCRLIVNEAAGGELVRQLASAGAKVVRWDMPAELWEPKSGPPINLDDLLSFHESLEDGHEELSDGAT